MINWFDELSKMAEFLFFYDIKKYYSESKDENSSKINKNNYIDVEFKVISIEYLD